jgi:hypothetical protein
VITTIIKSPSLKTRVWLKIPVNNITIESDGPADDVSLKTVLDAVNRQSKNTEAIFEAKVSAKIGVLRDEIHGTTQFMKFLIARFSALIIFDSSSESLAIGFASYYRAVSHPPSDVSTILISLLRCLSLSMQTITKSRT